MTRRTPKKRADLLLVDRGLAESREKAQALIMEGLVHSQSHAVLKPGSLVAADEPLDVKGGLPYVSRGGIKLAHALDCFNLDMSGQIALDVGASTGGFTDCLLQRGARKVFALDVGHGQIDYRLSRDSQVHVMERVNARYPFSLPGSGEERVGVSAAKSDPGGDDRVEHSGVVDLATIDVSFISVTKIIPSVTQHVKDGGYCIVLVKPQFEARRNEVGRGGVIRDPGLHARVLARVIRWVVDSRLRLHDLTPSPILGDAGNREFFLLIQK